MSVYTEPLVNIDAGKLSPPTFNGGGQLYGIQKWFFLYMNFKAQNPLTGKNFLEKKLFRSNIQLNPSQYHYYDYLLLYNKTYFKLKNDDLLLPSMVPWMDGARQVRSPDGSLRRPSSTDSWPVLLWRLAWVASPRWLGHTAGNWCRLLAGRPVGFVDQDTLCKSESHCYQQGKPRDSNRQNGRQLAGAAHGQLRCVLYSVMTHHWEPFTLTERAYDI